MGANKWNKKIEKSVRIRPIRVIRVPPPDRPPVHTNRRMHSPSGYPGAPAEGFQGRPPLLHGAGI
ncbi:MAG: hypothetical protein Q8M95_05605 [Candidatus Methanoperedens sp.]|nr:hypothetical protein [Candidatus Methanoperedens sp.]